MLKAYLHSKLMFSKPYILKADLYSKMEFSKPYITAVSAGIQMEKALGLYKHLSFLFIYSLSDRFTKNL